MYLSDKSSGDIFDNKYYPYSISTTQEQEYKLNGKYSSFYSDVTVYNYDNLDDDYSVDFYVYADDFMVAYLPNVHVGSVNQTISANIYNAQKIRLKTVPHGNKIHGCSAWLNPQVNIELSNIVAPLNDIVIIPPAELKHVNTCIVTVTDTNFIQRVDAMLYSLRENGKCDDAIIVVFAFGDPTAYKELVDKYDIVLIQCTLNSEFSYKIKTAAMSVAQVVDAKKYLYLDSDMLILDDMQPLFNLLNIVVDDKILVCKEASVDSPTLEHALCDPNGIYYAKYNDLDFLGLSTSERNYPLIVNNGVYCGSKKAILALESLVKSTLPNSAYWEKLAISSKIFWREQAIFNLALARGNTGIEISELYNMQLHTRAVDAVYAPHVPSVTYQGEKVKVLHFNGSGRGKYVETQHYYNEKSRLVVLPENNLKLYLDDFRGCLKDAKYYFYLIKSYLDINSVNKVLIIDNEEKLAENLFVQRSNMVDTCVVPDKEFFLDSSSEFVVPDNLGLILINDTFVEKQVVYAIIRATNVLSIGGSIIMKNNNISKKALNKIKAMRGINLIPIVRDDNVEYFVLTKFGV